MNGFEKKVFTFHTMLCNAYRNEDNQELPLEKLTLRNGGNLSDDLTAMMVAMKFLCDRLCPQLARDEDLVGFTHILNRLAIQHCFDDSKNEVEEKS